MDGSRCDDAIIINGFCSTIITNFIFFYSNVKGIDATFKSHSRVFLKSK